MNYNLKVNLQCIWKTKKKWWTRNEDNNLSAKYFKVQMRTEIKWKDLQLSNDPLFFVFFWVFCVFDPRDSEECWLLLSLSRMEEGTTYWKVIKKLSGFTACATASICAFEGLPRESFECDKRDIRMRAWVSSADGIIRMSLKLIWMNFTLYCSLHGDFLCHSNATVPTFE